MVSCTIKRFTTFLPRDAVCALRGIATLIFLDNAIKSILGIDNIFGEGHMYSVTVR